MQVEQIEKPDDLYAPGAIEALIAFHHAQFGDARMEAGDEGDEGDEGEGTNGDGNGDEGSEGDEGKDEGEGGEGGEPKAKPEDELPEWARNELKRVRGEAANYRTKFREATEKLKEAKTPEEFEAATKAMAEVNERLEKENMRLKVGQRFKLPADLIEVLKGDTEEEVEEHAKKLQQYAPVEQRKGLKGGVDPTEDDDSESDPRKLARLSPRR